MRPITRAALLLTLSLVSPAPWAADPNIDDETFNCIRDMTPVRGFFVANLQGDIEATVAVSLAGSGDYPEGSVIQLVPTEVMVKRESGFSPPTRDWEFIELEVSDKGSKILKRGTVGVVNRFGGNCFDCHVKANPGRDLVCEQGNGCDPIPLTPTMIRAIQNTDPRCQPVALPPEQVEALKQLQAALAKP
ncbi:MAG: hypothetical protein V2I26_02300 [Halieaceae bacterium]|jgi:hypothetical protein|nr:hypothetical protein [Halieaceae bacterium]